MFMRDIIVIGTSAGGVSALQTLCAGLPGNLAASIFVVQHLSPTSKSVLPWLLSRAGELPAFHPIDGEPIRPGHIHVAPPDHHLLVKPGHVLIRRGPKENRTRPAVDPLFRSAAIAYGSPSNVAAVSPSFRTPIVRHGPTCRAMPSPMIMSIIVSISPTCRLCWSG
jgi:chemotaxis response regulator CheB